MAVSAPRDRRALPLQVYDSILSLIRDDGLGPGAGQICGAVDHDDRVHLTRDGRGAVDDNDRVSVFAGRDLALSVNVAPSALLGGDLAEPVLAILSAVG